MNIRFEEIDLNKHDKHFLTKLIVESDEEMNYIVYGNKQKSFEIVSKLLEMNNNYFSSLYTKCLMYEDEIVGIISGFPVKEKEKIDKISGRAFMKTMGVFSFMRKMPLFMKMGNITGGEMDEDGYYIHTISVNSSFQGRGIGREVIKKLCEKHKKIYLHVNTNKFDAQAFYRKVGFIQKHKGTTVIKGKEIGTFLMEKKCD